MLTIGLKSAILMIGNQATTSPTSPISLANSASLPNSGKNTLSQTPATLLRIHSWFLWRPSPLSSGVPCPSSAHGALSSNTLCDTPSNSLSALVSCTEMFFTLRPAISTRLCITLCTAVLSSSTFTCTMYFAMLSGLLFLRHWWCRASWLPRELLRRFRLLR